MHRRLPFLPSRRPKATFGDMMAATNLFERSPFARVMADVPVTVYDIGARGGVDLDLLPLAFAVNAVAFEPHPEEYKRLADGGASAAGGPWRSLRYLPYAVSGTGGRRSLYVTTDPQGASLLRHDPAIGERFNKPQFFTVERTIDVDTRTLDEAAAGPPDFLKLDVEGAELEILQAAPAALANLVAIKTEVSFIPLRAGQPLAADIDRFLRDQGFILMDYSGFSHWRRQGYVIHPHVDRGDEGYSRGQIIHGDAIYFIDPESIADDDEAAVHRLLKAAFIAMGYGFFDHAAMILERLAVAAFLGDRYGIRAAPALRRTSRMYAWRACLRALARHLRGLGPYVRTTARLLR